MNILYGKTLSSRFESFIDTKDNRNTITSEEFTYPQQKNITFNYGHNFSSNIDQLINKEIAPER